MEVATFKVIDDATGSISPAFGTLDSAMLAALGEGMARVGSRESAASFVIVKVGSYDGPDEHYVLHIEKKVTSGVLF